MAEIATATGKRDRSGHQNTATDTQCACAKRSHSHAAFQQMLCRVLKRHSGASCQERYKQTTAPVANQNKQEIKHVSPAADKARRTGKELQAVVDYSGQTEDEEKHTEHLVGKETETGDADANASKNRRAEDG